MGKETKGWSRERRAKQAENIRNSKAWERSTGPRTAEGKQAVKNNAHKHGWRSEDIAEVRRLLRLQRRLVRDIESRHCEERQRRSNPESSPETLDCRVGPANETTGFVSSSFNKPTACPPRNDETGKTP